ncbi:hypothetical protein DL98DRAFT_37571 [Cadophora sp. DSE1049]|nr:hypothetical protein DL98DRAFT_37571 [Cadophora sp. DSE1049]
MVAYFDFCSFSSFLRFRLLFPFLMPLFTLMVRGGRSSIVRGVLKGVWVVWLAWLCSEGGKAGLVGRNGFGGDGMVGWEFCLDYCLPTSFFLPLWIVHS